MTLNDPILQIRELSFGYKHSTEFQLNISDFSVNKGSKIFIEGQSGCGKTTFLNLITGLIQPMSGQINIFGTDITQLNQILCDQFRSDHFGIIFQSFNLISYLSVIENIILPCTFSKSRKHNALKHAQSIQEDATRLCDELDIESHLIEKPVNQLSIGQQQRVAIARALIGQPEIIVADEPTSALDPLRTDQFMNLLLSKCDHYGSTLVFVSHDTSLQSHFDSVINLTSLTSPQKETAHVTA